MALIKLSSVGITAISGKAGGSVFSRNRGGEYFKNFVMPTNTITEARQAVRSIFGSLASAWRTLTQSERNTWIQQAPNYLRTNAFGDQKQLQPNALFVGQNTNLLNAGLSQISEIPAPQGTNGVVAKENSGYDVNGGSSPWGFTFSLEADNSTTDAPSHYVLEATPPHSQSKRNIDNQYRVLAKTADISPTPISGDNLEAADFLTGSEYADKFGAPEVGDVISYRIKAINPNTGEVSAYFYARDIAVAL